MANYLGDLSSGTGMYQAIDWQREQALQYAMQMQQQEIRQNPWFSLGFQYPPTSSSQPQSNETTLVLIKKSIKQIKAEAVSEQAQQNVRQKIERLKKLGVTTQAQVLEVELSLRIRLAKVMEWCYKVLPYDAIKEFDQKHKVTATRDGLKCHIDPLEKYCGATTVEDEVAKDRVIPDNVLDEIEKAKERQVFDDFSVLWVEKVKDPLLLGSIKGCKDYFLIAEWGEDVKFDDMVKSK